MIFNHKHPRFWNREGHRQMLPAVCFFRTGAERRESNKRVQAEKIEASARGMPAGWHAINANNFCAGIVNIVMKSTIKFAAIIAVLAGFLMVASPASAHARRHHHRHHNRTVVYVTNGYGYSGYNSGYYGYGAPVYYNTGYGYSSYRDPYYGSRYSYYGRPYYRRPAVSFSIGF